MGAVGDGDEDGEVKGGMGLIGRLKVRRDFLPLLLTFVWLSDSPLFVASVLEPRRLSLSVMENKTIIVIKLFSTMTSLTPLLVVKRG